MKILEYPNEILREKSIPVKKPTSLEVKHLISEMIQTLRSNNGLGLAAPQVGKNLRICVIEIENELFTLINPEIKNLSKELLLSEEGCLSIPNKFLNIKRHKRMKIAYIDSNGKKQILKTKGLLARVIQHEIDHLEGILMLDRVEEEGFQK